MNFFTPFSAYALYPCSTFVKRRSLVCGTILPPAQLALNKYEARGWTSIYSMTAERLLNHEGSDFKTNIRRIGDAVCWVHRQDSGMIFPMGEDVVWRLQYNVINAPTGIQQGAPMAETYYPFLQIID